MLTTEQRKMRRNGLGGSDVAAAIGVHPYRSPMAVYAEKTGELQPDEINPAIEWGNRLEPVIAQAYEEKHPVECKSYGVFTKKSDPWMMATPDRLVTTTGSGDLYGLEIKTAGPHTLYRWGTGPDDVPMEYLVQCAWYMAVMEIDRWDVAVLLAGQDYREYTLHRDRELEAQIVEAARNFWFNHVLALVPPPVDGHESTKRALAKMYPHSGDTIIAAEPRHDLLMLDLRDAKAAADKATAELERVKNELRASIGDADGVAGSVGKVTWRENKNGSRVFRADIKEAS